jgi:cytochrome c peroxidase
MKRAGSIGFGLGAAIFAALGFERPPEITHASLALEIFPMAGTEPLEFANTQLQTPAGETATVTRLDFLISDLSLQRRDGSWMILPDWSAFFSLEQNRLEAEAVHFPIGRYTALRFNVGLRPDLNHQDPSGLAPNHPLNPELNGLHWGWQGGYVFLALEGKWGEDRKSFQNGYSFHIATARQVASVVIPSDVFLEGNARLRIGFDLEGMFHRPNPVQISAAESTHSRENDPLADQLRQNLEQAFSFLELAAVEEKNQVQASHSSQPLGTTPYRLRFSRVFTIPDLPRDNPLTEEGVELGRQLFHEVRLSGNNRQSCASCHAPASAFSDSPKRVSAGAFGEEGTRNAMPLFNLAWKREFGWDGMASSLREQVLRPIEDPLEMHGNIDHTVVKLKEDAGYQTLFQKAFGSAEISGERVALALEQFLLTRISSNSRFDQASRGEANLSDEEKRGFQLFFTEFDPRREQLGADCFHCHGGANFTNHRFANNGLDTEPKDLGRYLTTLLESDRGKFSVPSLRNIELTAPYMHDGRFATLDDVIEHYSAGVQSSLTLDPNLAKHPESGIPLSSSDKAALVAFLKTLTETAASALD